MILYGASGHGKVIWEILEAIGMQPSAIWDDADKEPFWGLIVTKPKTVADEKIIISIGDNKLRKLISERYNINAFGTALHPSAIISSRAAVGAGTVIMSNAVVNADVVIGKHCIINTAAVVEHENRIGDYVHISPNATLCGNVTINEGTHIGAGAVIIPGIKIGSWCRIGAGAIVIRNVPDGVTVVGNPAKVRI